MAGWDCDYNNDDDVLNPNLFARKSFGFQGISEEKENILKKIVMHIGASCDEYPKYIFTSIEHYNSLTDVNSALYNVTYIRDCVDANRCLTIEHYKFGPKYSEKKEYREFDPCCANFHNGNEACLVCDPTFKTDVPVTTKRTKIKSTAVSEANITKIKKENKVQNSSASDEVSGAADSGLGCCRKRPWEPWENRMVLDYLICNKQIAFSKGPNVYRKMNSDGFLKHRTPESARIHFRTKILKNIESYDLPQAVLKEFKLLRKASAYSARLKTTFKRKHHLKKLRVVNKMRKQSAKES